MLDIVKTSWSSSPLQNGRIDYIWNSDRKKSSTQGRADVNMHILTKRGIILSMSGS